MRFAIVGAGAMGSLFGGYLARVGADVTLIDVDRAHVEAINEAGLLFDTGDGPRPVRVAATIDPATVGEVDLVIVFCKYRHTDAAVAGAQPMIGARTHVWTLQNGIGNVDIIRRHVSEERVAKGLTSATGILRGPGSVTTNFQGTTETYYWPIDGGEHPVLTEAARLMTEAGLPTHAAPDIDYRIWRKLVINASLTAVSAAVNTRIGTVAVYQPGVELLEAITDEVVAVAQASGVPLEREDARGYLRELSQKAVGHIGSMTIDLQAGNATEVDAMNGAVVREGARHGVPTPVNETIARLVKLIEATRAERLSPAI